jgi:hypothetical protein
MQDTGTTGPDGAKLLESGRTRADDNALTFAGPLFIDAD